MYPIASLNVKMRSRTYRVRKVMKKNFDEFCDESTIHGMKYIGQRKRVERISWIIICVLLLCGCGTQIYEIVGKWRQNPLIFLMDQKVSPISDIPFPAVTICPQRMPNRNRFNYSDFMQRFMYSKDRTFTGDELKLFDVVTRLCVQNLLKYGAKFNPYIDEIPVYNNDELLDVMNEYFLSHFMKMTYCQGILRNRDGWECNVQFYRIWLREGLCYTFNLLPRDQIFRENVSYPLAKHPNFIIPVEKLKKMNHSTKFDDELIEQPMIHTVDSRRERLHVRSRMFEDFTDPACKPDFFVFIHNPYEIPWDRQSKGYLIEAEEFVKNMLTVTPSVIRTDDSLKESFTSEERACYFADERPLKFFKQYSQNNCELECMANQTAKTYDYNCVTYWMPRTNETRLCRFEKYLLFDVQMKFDLKKCNCLPECNQVDYDVRLSTSHTPFYDDSGFTQDHVDNDQLGASWKYHLLRRLFLGIMKEKDFEIHLDEAFQKANITADFDILKIKFTEIEVNYEDSEFLAMRRHLAYSFADFVSQIGGILGCFLGISIFSIVKIVYFCVGWIWKGPKKEKKKAPKENERVFTILSPKRRFYDDYH